MWLCTVENRSRSVAGNWLAKKVVWVLELVHHYLSLQVIVSLRSPNSSSCSNYTRCLGLLFGVTVYQLEVTGQPPPELDSNPPVGDLAEGRPWTLKCIFNRSALGFAIVVGTVETPVEGLKVRVAELDADAVPRLLATENLLEYTVRTVPTRRLNNLPISCRQNYFLNSTAVHTVITKTLLVKCW